MKAKLNLLDIFLDADIFAVFVYMGLIKEKAMTTVACKKCSFEVKVQAKDCPKCGVENPGVTKKEMIIASSVIAVIALIATIWFGDDEKDTAEMATATASVKKERSYSYSDISISLKAWQPISTSSNNGNLVIILDQPRITDKIFSAAVETGACAHHWTENPNSLDGIKEVHVLNRHGVQGYIFENAKDSCDTMGVQLSDEARITMLGNSRLF